jgi:hypothetical protein
MDSRLNVTFTLFRGGALVPLSKSFAVRAKRARMASHNFGISQFPPQTKIASATLKTVGWERVSYNPPTTAKSPVMAALQLVISSGEEKKAVWAVLDRVFRGG